jgi:S1-C subfamily serine protease
MWKTYGTLITTVLFCTFLTTSLAAHNWDKQVEIVSPYVIHLSIEVTSFSPPKTSIGACSAWVFNAAKGYAATAGHCVHDSYGNEARRVFVYVDGQEQNATVLALSTYPEPDIAILSIPAIKGFTKLRQASTPKIGQEVMMSGFADTHTPLHKWGKIVFTDASIFVNTLAMPGMSGGPVTDYRNRVIGLTNMRFVARGVSKVTPIEAIQALAKEHDLD